MPWNREDFKEGGTKGITEFIGVLDEVEDEVPGKFDKLQDVYHFSAVEITQSEEDVTLENDELVTYTTHSRRKNSTSGKLAELWMDFCDAQRLDSPPDSLYGMPIRYKRETFDFGPDMNPGSGFVPVEIPDAKPSKKVRGAAQVTHSGRNGKNAPPALDAKLVALAVATAGEDGATRDLLRRELTKRASDRASIVALGGIDTYLTLLVESGDLTEDDGVYVASPS